MDTLITTINMGDLVRLMTQLAATLIGASGLGLCAWYYLASDKQTGDHSHSWNMVARPLTLTLLVSAAAMIIGWLLTAFLFYTPFSFTPGSADLPFEDGPVQAGIAASWRWIAILCGALTIVIYWYFFRFETIFKYWGWLPVSIVILAVSSVLMVYQITDPWSLHQFGQSLTYWHSIFTVGVIVVAGTMLTIIKQKRLFPQVKTKRFITLAGRTIWFGWAVYLTGTILLWLGNGSPEIGQLRYQIFLIIITATVGWWTVGIPQGYRQTNRQPIRIRLNKPNSPYIQRAAVAAWLTAWTLVMSLEYWTTPIDFWRGVAMFIIITAILAAGSIYLVPTWVLEDLNNEPTE